MTLRDRLAETYYRQRWTDGRWEQLAPQHKAAYYELVDVLLAEIEAAGYDMIEHIPMADPDAPIRHWFTVIPEEDSYFIQFPDLPGCMTQAETLYEIGPMAQDAYVNWTQAARDGGHTIPEPKQ